jgi:choline dehydrogenase-like flavoprotein
VADASVMPVITNGNINAPNMMIGERVANLLLNGAIEIIRPGYEL